MTEERILKIKKTFEMNYPIIKTCTLRKNKICSRDINELIEYGYVIRVKTGYYAWKSEIEELTNFELAQSIIPSGIISLTSAANFHGLINSSKEVLSVCIMIPTKMTKPILPDFPVIDLFYCSCEKIEIGYIEVQMKHRDVNIYNMERTVCDLFKYKDKIKNETALESLKNYMKREDKNIQRLLEYSSILRVQKYIRPLVEVLI